MNHTSNSPPLLETVVRSSVIEQYLVAICEEGPPMVVFNSENKDIVDRYGPFQRCFSQLRKESEGVLEVNGETSLPIHRAARCIDTLQLSEFLIRFFEKDTDWDYFECEGFSRHYAGAFRDTRRNVVGYYLAGPVTRSEVVPEACPFVLGPQGCPYAQSDEEIADLEIRLETFREFISEKYQTELRRAHDAPGAPAFRLSTPPVDDTDGALQHVRPGLLDKAAGDADMKRKVDDVHGLLFPDQVEYD